MEAIASYSIVFSMVKPPIRTIPEFKAALALEPEPEADDFNRLPPTTFRFD